MGAKWPAVFNTAFWVQSGAVVSYGSNAHADGVQAARLVAKILRGARPQDLPVEGANKIELAINLKTAKSLGVTIPREILARADQVKLADLLGKGPVVIYTFIQAFSAT
ncbi:MAG: hypothetical protein HYU32_02620 [candidate division NC10 bacterium]|nr:hypothetical protein [candidate division NC10 bacterium]